MDFSCRYMEKNIKLLPSDGNLKPPLTKMKNCDIIQNDDKC